MASAGDQVGGQARITVRYYRSSQVITQYAVPVDARKQGNAVSVTFSYRSNGVNLDRNRLVEVETAIATSKGSYLFYTEAMAAGPEVEVEVPFLLYGNDPQVRWPALGSSVQVGGYLSKIPLTKTRAADSEDFSKNGKNEYTITVQILNAQSGASYGTDSVTTKPGEGRNRTLTFSNALQVPEGATVRYILSAQAKNGRTWSAAGTTTVWTTKMNYPDGFKAVTIFVDDDLARED